MNEKIKELHELISKQQGQEGTTVWCVGEQLKGIVGADIGMAEIVIADLKAKGMTIADCEKRIRAKADELHKKNGGKGAGVSPRTAEEIIRKFYGLDKAKPTPAAEPVRSADIVDLSAFF